VSGYGFPPGSEPGRGSLPSPKPRRQVRRSRGSAVVDGGWQDRQLTGESSRAASGLTLSAEVHHAFQGSPRDSHTGGLHCLHLPLSSAEPGGLLALAARRVPDAQFPTKTPAGRRSSCPVTTPGGQPDPIPRAGSVSVAQLRWVPRPDDERSQLLTDVADSGLPARAGSPRGSASPVERAVLPVRSPGTHLHPLLRRAPVAGRCGEGGGS
jgi:hypothetical protein